MSYHECLKAGLGRFVGSWDEGQEGIIYYTQEHMQEMEFNNESAGNRDRPKQWLRTIPLSVF